MDRRSILLGSLGATVAAIGVTEIAQAQDGKDAIQKAIQAFEAALSSLDIDKMMALWAEGQDVVLINPRDKDAAIGTDAVRKRWQETFAFWETLKVSSKGSSIIRAGQSGGFRYTAENVEGKPKGGNAVSRTVLATTSFRKVGERWLISLHHASNAQT